MLQTTQVPAGFQSFGLEEGHVGLNGPYFFKSLPAGDFAYGFPTDDRHSNPNGVVHGGALFGFVDTFLGHRVVTVTGRYCATISITTEFMAAAHSGEWLDGKAEIKKVTGSMVFLAAEVHCKGEILLVANSVFKLFAEQ